MATPNFIPIRLETIRALGFFEASRLNNNKKHNNKMSSDKGLFLTGLEKT